MACWNMFIPYIVPTLPAAQKEALAYNVKRPIVYTSVAIKTGVVASMLSGVSHITPGMYHLEVSPAEAVSLGDLRHPQSPEEPVVVHMGAHPARRPADWPQHRIGRASCWRPLSRPSSAISAISSTGCWVRAASMPRTTLSRSR